MGQWINTCSSSLSNPMCCISQFAGFAVAGMNAEMLGLNPSMWAISYLFSGCCAGGYLRGEIRKKYEIPVYLIF